MSKSWSGLAPAVDAHIDRWAFAHRHLDLAEACYDNRQHGHFERWVNSEHGYHWTLFGASYGIPDADGVPMATAAVMEGTTIAGREQFQAEGWAAFQGAHLAMREHTMLDRAISHYISAPVVAEVTAAAELAEPEPLFSTDLFTPYGFAVLERPLIVPDLDPETGNAHPTLVLWVRAIGWAYEPLIGTADPDDDELRPGVSIFLYTTADDYTDGYYASAVAAGLTVPYEPEVVRDGFCPVEVIPWSFGRSWSERHGTAHVHQTVPGPVAFQRRWFLALMRLMWQTIIVRHTPHEPRHNVRRWERLARRKELLDYTVLRLRREVDPDYEPTGVGVALDHRVRVRAHWRRQHYPSLGVARLADGSMNPESHRLVWVESHWRGPEDGPLGAMHAATSVVR